MLKFLHIENIAVIERSDIEFEDGFNVLTGETGAGKSILIDAIGAVLGERTSKDLIRSGFDTAEVSAVFGCFDSASKKMLESSGIFPDCDGNIIIKRKLSLQGKGYIRINGEPATATLLKEISAALLNIHGQHDNQALLNSDNHCGYIDAMAQNCDVLSEYYAEFKKLNAIRRELNLIETDEEEKQRKNDLLKYQIKEIEDAGIKPGEINELKEKLTVAQNYQSVFSALSKAEAALSGDEDNFGAAGLISDALKFINSLHSEKWAKTAEKLITASSLLSDAEAEINGFLSDDGNSLFNADEISARLDILDRLMLKYGNSESAMLDFLEKSKAELEKIEMSDKRINELSAELDDSTDRLVMLGERLTQTRKKAAAGFEKAVCDILVYLNMPSIRFKVNITGGRYTKTGCDNVEFLISANNGEDLKPLKKIASGGELSRVMLAIKSVLSDKDSVGTMIFDEIDTGISGYTAGKVGVQLKKVSKSRQVICVTHLAQIAAMANNHLLIEKTEKSGRSFTNVKSLDYESRIKEIARIMSGQELTESIYNSAKELLDRSITDDNL